MNLETGDMGSMDIMGLIPIIECRVGGMSAQ